MRKQFVAAAAAVLISLAAVAATDAARTAVPPLDAHWLKATAQSDMFEVTMGKLALQKGAGTTCTVARMLITDHTKAYRQTQRLAAGLRTTVPRSPNALQQSLIQLLSQASGTSFEQLFTLIGLGAHRLDIHEAQTVQRQGQLAQVRTLATQQLPVLRRHLAMFVTLSKSSAPTSTAAGATTSTAATTQSTSAQTTSTSGQTTGSNATGCGSTSSP
jgi:hypothetical protein